MTGRGDILPGTAETFRTLWRGFGSGVTLIATETGGETFAMVATAAISVSMEPPSLLISVNRSASAYDALCARGAFSLGILDGESAGVGMAIARAPTAERCAHGTWRKLDGAGAPVDGLPWLAETQATFFCATDTTVDYGTHRLFIARVLCATGKLGDDPLLYCGGRFGRFAEIGA
ncbi:flavin reductase family protein [Salipiger sp. P9]|uniref:flavin reductase family protein n=1 Tax=Salipiger pentaromativorans TaxID=2943193 RepID=UPI002157EEAD|nr:flavin reductase family protein [Salipiger pentaromativorans]MCR8549228.1 flavin reductase family protein [Salipiger pentaromativorans]